MRRLALVFAFPLLTAPVLAQGKPSAQIPATATTQNVSDLPSAHPAVSSAAGQSSVLWSGSTLSIRGNGDSLRNILRSVSQATGMRITGGVPEEAVYGNYGPGPVQAVLPQLFDGIAVNVLLMNDGPNRPKELLLSQRNGAASPPQTRPIADEDQGFSRSGNVGPRPFPNQLPPPQPDTQAPPPGMVIPSAQLPAGASSNATGAGTDASGQPQSPNGVRTPEQIFEELRKRQQNATQK